MGRKLQEGENSILSARPTKLANGSWSLQWRIRYEDGRIEKHTTCRKGTIGELRRKALRKAEELRTSNRSNSGWKRSSSMTDYIKEEVISAIKKSGSLAPRTITAYRTALTYMAAELKGYSIADASRIRVIEQAAQRIAEEHGTATARQALKVTSKHVMSRLVRDELVQSNPLRDYTPDLPSHIAKHRPAGGQALSPAEHEKVISYLLSADPQDVFSREKNQHRRTREDRVRKWRLVIDATLLQSATGMRIGEIRLLQRKCVLEDKSPLVIHITPEVSKTKRGRRIPVLDERIESRLRDRLAKMSADPEALVFPAPSSFFKEWDSSNAQKAIRELYTSLASILDIPLLNEVRSHVWRTTLNTEWMEKGVPDVIRSAYFGHTEDVNRQYYTDLTDISPLMQMLLSKETEEKVSKMVSKSGNYRDISVQQSDTK